MSNGNGGSTKEARRCCYMCGRYDHLSNDPACSKYKQRQVHNPRLHAQHLEFDNEVQTEETVVMSKIEEVEEDHLIGPQYKSSGEDKLVEEGMVEEAMEEQPNEDEDDKGPDMQIRIGAMRPYGWIDDHPSPEEEEQAGAF